MRILSRYFVARFIGFFLATLFVSTLIIAVVEMLLNFDDMLKVDQGLTGAARYLFLRIPAYYLRDLIPISVFTATFFSLGIASQWREIMAMKAGGVSPHRAAFPILATAALLSLGAFAVNETLVVRAIQQWSLQQGEGGEELSFRRGSFWYHRDGAIFNVREADKDTRTLRGVRYFERSPEGRLIRTIEAERVEIEDNGHWRFLDATIRIFDAESPSAAPTVEHIPETRLPMLGGSAKALLRADPRGLSMQMLTESIDAGLTSTVENRLQTLLHARLADPFGVLLFALLAVPLALRVEHHKSLGLPALYGITLIAVFYSLRSAGTSLGNEGVLPAPLAPWSVLALFGSTAAWLLARMPR